MVTFANAKINLGLNVVSRRPDGYHNILTCFYPAGLYTGLGEVNPAFDSCADVIEVTDSAGNLFSRMGHPVDCPPDEDLAFRAFRLFREEYPDLTAARPAALSVLKRLPSGAGLGGGSADAAFTLRLLNEFYGAGLGKERLVELAARLGADCPFFIHNRPMSACGTGDVFSALPKILDGYWGAIVQPDYTISTREAFGAIAPNEPESPPVDIVTSLPPEEWRGRLVNDFERSMFSKHPEAREIKTEMYNMGAIYSAMSGSGSAFYGIFPTRGKAIGYLDNVSFPVRLAIRF